VKHVKHPVLWLFGLKEINPSQQCQLTLGNEPVTGDLVDVTCRARNDFEEEGIQPS
jgi:hypothetical protein